MWPTGQAHAPVLQVAPPVHSTPQAPQLPIFDEVSTHKPAHSTVPTGQLQVPAVHGLPTGHAMPQAPQLPGSVNTLLQWPLQLIVGDWHTSVQLPPAQAWPGLH